MLAHASTTAAAGISSSPTIVGGSGDTSGATLQVQRPGNMSDDAVATYLIQAFSDADGKTKVGRRAGVCVLPLTACPADLAPFAHHQGPGPHQLQMHSTAATPPCVQVGNEVRGNNTADGADGTDGKAFVFPYPFTTGAQLYFTVTVVVGGTRSGASLVYGPIVVGEWRLAAQVACHWGLHGVLPARATLQPCMVAPQPLPSHTWDVWCLLNSLPMPHCPQAPPPRRACSARWAAKPQPPSASPACPRQSSTV